MSLTRPRRLVAVSLRAPALAALMLALAVAACAVTPAGSGPASPGGSPALAPAAVTLEEVATGFAAPLLVTTAPDGSGRLFVGEQGGRIRIVEDGLVRPAPFLDISDRVAAGGERGLLGVAFPPGFGDDRRDVYVHYSDANGDTVVAAFAVTGDPRLADPGSERVILREPQPYANHNGGWIGFDPQGRLLVALGDGGSGGDPENRASDRGQLLGKLLRIDVLGADAAGVPYAIPADNPFAGGGGRPEILHLGLRNPFRASIDPPTGDLWIGDVGQGAWEEVDVARAGSRGLDFGWRRWEGRHCYDPPSGCDPAGVTQPVAEYPHDLGCSVIGGVVYRGDAIPSLRGWYLFSDYCSGTVWAIEADRDDEQRPVTLLESGRSIAGFGVGDDGEVYLADLGGGTILRLAPGS